uniref:Uncharacterized protein n=1 Tax=Arundo donax TaxID=35708 RepID=A0A0A9FE17_ARUDO
MPASTSARRFS